MSLIGDNILASLGNYSWTIPVNNSDINKGGQFKIVISKNGSSNVFDNSDNYFTITSSGGGCSNGEVYSPTTGHKCSTPIISSVSGPQTLNVNQTGTWTVNASDPSNSVLSYSVDWGETVSGVVNNEYKANSAYIQTATFTHTYSTAGTYNPTFTVTNSNGQSAKTSLSVNVGNTIQTLPTLKVFLDSSTPASQTIPAGKGNIVFAKIKITAGSKDVNNLNAIQIGSDLANAAKLTGLAVYDGATQIGTTNYGLSYNGSYYQSWIYLKGALIIPAYTSKVLSVVADTSPEGSGAFFTGSVRLGIVGWTFDSPGAVVDPLGTVIYGNTFTITSSASTNSNPVWG